MSVIIITQSKLPIVVLSMTVPTVQWILVMRSITKQVLSAIVIVQMWTSNTTMRHMILTMLGTITLMEPIPITMHHIHITALLIAQLHVMS